MKKLENPHALILTPNL